MTRNGLIIIALAISARGAMAQGQHVHNADTPRTMRDEHEEIQWSLQAATKAPGAVGAAARELERLLKPHIAREEGIALPPLGVLRRLVDMEDVSLMQWIVPITDSMKQELPRMLEEHVAINQARVDLERAAQRAGNRKVMALTMELARHAQWEEDVSYPTAVLVGEIVRGRIGRKSE
jgi:hypothetical protein